MRARGRRESLPVHGERVLPVTDTLSIIHNKLRVEVHPFPTTELENLRFSRISWFKIIFKKNLGWTAYVQPPLA